MTTKDSWGVWATACLVAGLVAGSVGCSAQAKRERQFERAESAYKKGDYSKAEIEYLLAARTDPTNALILSRLGTMYAEEGATLKAFSLLLQARAMLPTNTQVMLSQAQLLQTMGRRHQEVFGMSRETLAMLRDVRDEAAAVLALDPHSGPALTLLIRNSFATNELSDAERRLQTFRQQNGENGYFSLGQALLALQRGEPDVAERTARQALTADPKLYETHLLVAELAQARSNWTLADSEFRQAIELAPIRSGASLRYATYKIERNQPDEARKIVEETTRKAPDYLYAWEFLTELQLREQHPDEALESIRRVLFRDEANLDALNLQANVWLAKKEPAKALESLESVVGMANGYAQQWQQWFQQFRTNAPPPKGQPAGKPSAAEQARAPEDRALLRRITLTFCPRLPQILTLSATLQTNQVRALEHLRQATELDPNNVNARVLLTRLELARGRDPSAAAIGFADYVGQIQRRVEVLDKMLGRTNALVHPEVRQFFLRYYQAVVFLAELYASPGVGRLDDAVNIYRQLVKGDPQNTGFRLGLGIALQREKKDALARAEYEQILKLEPGSLGALAQLSSLDVAATNQAAALRRLQPELARQPKSPQLYYLQGLVYASASNTLDQAESSLRKSLELDANYFPAYSLLARVYLGKHQPQESVAQLTALLQKQPQDTVSSLLLAEVYKSLKPPDYPRARDAYESILRSRPNFLPALNSLAFLYCDRLKNLDKAFKLASTAHNLAPDDPYIADTLGWILYRRGDYSQALALIQESAAKLTDSPDVQFHLGMAYYVSGLLAAARTSLQQAVNSTADYPGKDEAKARLALLQRVASLPPAQAIPDLEKAIKEDPKDLGSLIRLGQLYEQQDNAKKAGEAFEQAVGVNAAVFIPLLELARLYAGPLRNPAKALDYVNKARALEPANPQAMLVLAELKFQSGDFAYAYTLLQECARNLPGNPQASYDLGWAAYSLGKLGEARQAMASVQKGQNPTLAAAANQFLTFLDAYERPQDVARFEAQANQVLKSDPNYAPALLVLGMIQGQRGQPETRQTFERVLSRFPQFTPAQRMLALLYAADPAKEGQAFDLAFKAREAMPGDPALTQLLGKLYFNRKDYPSAVRLLQPSLRQTPANPEALYYLGNSYYQLRDKVNAKTALQQALAAGLKGKLADEAKRLLAL